MRLIANGCPVEDIDLYGRCHQLFDTLKPSETRVNDQLEGMSNFAQEDYGANKTEKDAGAVEQLIFSIMIG